LQGSTEMKRTQKNLSATWEDWYTDLTDFADKHGENLLLSA